MSNIVLVGATGDIGASIHAQLKASALITFSKSKTPRLPSTHHFLDLSKPFDESDIEHYFNHLESVDTLIFTPGEALFELIQDTKLNEVDKQYNVSVRALITFIKVILPKLRKSDNPSIIVISSVWGTYGASLESIYSTFKGAQETLVKSLAKELAPSNITVNAVAPGVVRGKMTEKLDSEDIAMMLDDLPQGRLIEPREVASAIEYLISENARSITGEILKINGGWYT